MKPSNFRYDFDSSPIFPSLKILFNADSLKAAKIHFFWLNWTCFAPAQSLHDLKKIKTSHYCYPFRFKGEVSNPQQEFWHKVTNKASHKIDSLYFRIYETLLGASLGIKTYYAKKRHKHCSKKKIESSFSTNKNVFIQCDVKHFDTFKSFLVHKYQHQHSDFVYEKGSIKEPSEAVLFAQQFLFFQFHFFLLLKTTEKRKFSLTQSF